MPSSAVPEKMSNAIVKRYRKKLLAFLLSTVVAFSLQIPASHTAHAEPVSGTTIMYGAGMLLTILSEISKSQVVGADSTRVAVVQNQELLLRLQNQVMSLGRNLTHIHERINSLPEEISIDMEFQFDQATQQEFYGVIRALIDEVRMYEKGIKPKVSEEHRIHALEVSRNTLMQRSVLNAPTIIYGWVYEIAYRKARRHDRKTIEYIDNTYRQWLQKALHPNDSQSLRVKHKQWKERRKQYGSHLSDEIKSLSSKMVEYGSYFRAKSGKPDDCNAWLFCNMNTSGKKYENRPNSWPTTRLFRHAPYLVHDADRIKYPGHCKRDKHDAYFVTMTACDWTRNYKIENEIDAFLQKMTEKTVEISPQIELYYSAILWEFIYSELMKRVEASLSGQYFQPSELDLSSSEYWVWCGLSSEDIHGCWNQNIDELMRWSQLDAFAWTYSYRCLQHIDTWNLLAGPFPYKSASSTPGPCKKFDAELRRIFDTKNVTFRQHTITR